MNIQFQNLKDVRPEHGKAVTFIAINQLYGYWLIEESAVEYVWSDGEENDVTYDPANPTPPRPSLDEEGKEYPFSLFISIGGQWYREGDDLLWCYCDAITDEIEKALNLTEKLSDAT